MQLFDWNSGWSIIFTLVLQFYYVQSHALHYYKLKKFLTAVAFARALGKRPTILPIPVPIPIPIAQNEVIKIPMGSAGKTTIIDGGKGGKPSASSHVLNVGSLVSSAGHGYTGSSPYGYSIPGYSEPSVINLSSLKGSDSNKMSLASILGSRSKTEQPQVLILGGGGSGFPSSSLLGGSGLQLVPSSHFGGNSAGLGESGHFGGVPSDLDAAFSLKSPYATGLPVYNDRPMRKFPFGFRGRRMKSSGEDCVPGSDPQCPLVIKQQQQGQAYNNPHQQQGQAYNNHHQQQGQAYNNHQQQAYNQQQQGGRQQAWTPSNAAKSPSSYRNPTRSPVRTNAPVSYRGSSEGKRKKPIPIGEKFGYKP